MSAPSLVDLPDHRFERVEVACWWRCSPPPIPGLGRPASACHGCGLTVSDEEVLASGLVAPGGEWSDLYLNTVVLLRARRLHR